MTLADAHVTIFSVQPSPEPKILTKNKKKIFENLATSKDIDKNNKNFLNLATYHCAVTSADAYVTIFSVLLSPEAEILTKNKKDFLKIWQRIIVRCPRDYFQRSTFTRGNDFDKKQKKGFLKIWQSIIVR
ncbi:hypothetical protein PUN28_020717 [Cardiocondyla obscurior]|uniref:Uncharacterized protein n=1 Tax=Cardiocondyla obscurior TaxID=286306 RepID=A0AAW2E914_9HYME